MLPSQDPTTLLHIRKIANVRCARKSPHSSSGMPLSLEVPESEQRRSVVSECTSPMLASLVPPPAPPLPKRNTVLATLHRGHRFFASLIQVIASPILLHYRNRCALPSSPHVAKYQHLILKSSPSKGTTTSSAPTYPLEA